METLWSLFAPLFPTLLATLAPAITGLVKSGLGDKIPASVKPVINAVAGVVLAGLAGGDPTAGVAGALVGNRVREALKS